jgi:hypothetical protein
VTSNGCLEKKKNLGGFRAHTVSHGQGPERDISRMFTHDVPLTFIRNNRPWRLRSRIPSVLSFGMSKMCLHGIPLPATSPPTRRGVQALRVLKMPSIPLWALYHAAGSRQLLPNIKMPLCAAPIPAAVGLGLRIMGRNAKLTHPMSSLWTASWMGYILKQSNETRCAKRGSRERHYFHARL